MAQNQVTKIYKLSTLGFDVVDKQLLKIQQDFENIKKAKQSAEGKILNTSDTAEIKKFSEEIARLKIREQELRVERQQMLNEQKAGNIARQEELRLQKAKLSGNLAEEGSIVRIRLAIRELNAALIVKNQKGNATINFQGEILSIDQAVAKLKQLTAAEQEFRRQFQKDQTLVGEYTTGIVQAFRAMGLDDLVGGQITRTKEKLNSLNADFDRLQKELQETKNAGKSTESIELQMIENRNEVIKLDTELVRLKTDLRGTGDIGNQVSTALSNGFKSLKGQIGSFALQFVGIAAIINKAQQGISEAKLSSDATTDLQIQLGQTADEADRLNESLKNLNTRTSLLGLQEIANVALRAGVTGENILAVTEAIDKTKVAFGKDFGSIEQGTETFAKLINIFFTDGEITGDRILKIGNSIRALANETVASVPFMTDFSGRMAGVKQIANVTLPDILGLGAGFEEFKQSAEVSSTTLVKIIPKLATDIDKFAQIAGLASDEFRTLLTETPIEALLKVAEGLVKGKGDVEEFAKTLSDAGLDAGRVTTIIATLGGKADVFRERIKRAGETITSTGAITDAFAKKNTNLAAQMDKLNKVFTDFFASKTFQTILAAISGLLIILINNLPIIIGLVSLLTVAWVAQNATLISLRAQLILYNLGIGANLVLLNLLRVAQLAYNAILFAFNGVLTLVTATLRVFGVTAAAATGPLAAILTILGLLGGAFLGLQKAMGKAVETLDANIQRFRALNEINDAARRIYSDQIAKINSWITVIKSATTSVDTKKRAVDELTKINARFGSVIKDNVIDLKELEKAYLEVTDAIKLQAKAQATADITARKQQKVVALEVARQEIEIATAAGGDLFFNTKTTDLPKEVVDLIKNLRGTQVIKNLDLSENVAVTQKDLPKVIAELTKQEESARQEFQLYLSLKEKAENKLESFLNDQQTNSKLFEVDIKDLKDKIDTLDKQISGFQGSQAELKKKIADRNRLQKELDRLLGKTEPPGGGRGSRLTGEQKDAFKDIEALRDKEVADEKIRLQTKEINEETFLKNILVINEKAIDDKLKLLKGANAEERKEIAELNLEKITLQQETNDKLFDLLKDILKKQLEAEIANIKLRDAQIQNDPTLSAVDRAQAKLDADNAILILQEEFNARIDILEKKLAQKTLSNTKESAEEIRKTKEQILEDQRAVAEAALSDIADNGEKERAKIIANYEKLRRAILDNDKLTASQREKALEKLAKLHNKTIISSELKQLIKEFAEIKRQYEAGLKSEKEFLEKKKELEQKKTQAKQANIDLSQVGIILPSVSETQKLLSEKLSKAFGFKEQSAEAQLLGEVISQTFDLATEAMNSFFDAERDRIEENLQLQLERLDLQQQQVTERAQSQAEIEAIEKEFAAKKRKAEREAGEQLKKSRRSEAKIALATELANIAASAAANPANAFTFGAAGVIMYGILAGLALGRYALRIGEINREKFQFGGQVKKKQTGHAPTEKGGQAKGKSHAQGGIPFNYEAEDQELFIINKRSAIDKKVRTITGTNKQIASKINELGGGVSFEKGAKLKKFATGGIIGDVLQPPVLSNASSIINNFNGITKEDLEEFKDAIIERTDATDRRIDRIKVAVDSKEITKAQDKTAKQSSIGTL